MKKSEIRKLVEEYRTLKSKSQNPKIQEKLKEIEHRYFHETGEDLKND
jgi:hypothetical protein